MKRLTKRERLMVFAAGAGLATATSAMANLASFEANDGYWFQIGAWCDVTNYNAGAHGPNSGGGPGPTMIAMDTGLFKLQGQVGDFFGSSANRLAAFGAAPPYPASASNAIPSYLIGNHPGGRTGNALAIRNATPSGTGANHYDYTLDSFDFGGIAPATVTSGTIGTSFWYEANDADSSTAGTQDKFIMSFGDSGGNVGFQWGYARNNTVQYRAGSSGPWTTTTQLADNLQYDGLDVTIDLSAQTFGIQYFDTSASSWVTIAPSGTAMGATMSDFTHMGWSLADNVTFGSNGYGGKNFFDDFKFAVPAPEPASVGVAMLCGMGVLLRRPTRNTKH